MCTFSLENKVFNKCLNLNETQEEKIINIQSSKFHYENKIPNQSRIH